MFTHIINLWRKLTAKLNKPNVPKREKNVDCESWHNNSRPFASIGQYTVYSDPRDIRVTGMNDFEVVKWCRANQIEANISFKISGGDSLWRVVDDKQRVLFALRWG